MFGPPDFASMNATFGIAQLPNSNPAMHGPPPVPPAPAPAPLPFQPPVFRQQHEQVTAVAKPWASEIVDGLLWLGSGRAAELLDEMERRGIRHVLNVADDVPNFHEGKLIYKRLEVRDFGQDSGIARVFDQAFAFLAEREARKEPCLVHCAQGANRSATIAIAWVMKRSECKLEEAWAVVKAKRPGIVPLRDNRLALWELERKLHGCNFLSLDDVQRL